MSIKCTPNIIVGNASLHHTTSLLCTMPCNIVCQMTSYVKPLTKHPTLIVHSMLAATTHTHTHTISTLPPPSHCYPLSMFLHLSPHRLQDQLPTLPHTAAPSRPLLGEDPSPRCSHLLPPQQPHLPPRPRSGPLHPLPSPSLILRHLLSLLKPALDLRQEEELSKLIPRQIQSRFHVTVRVPAQFC